MEHLLNAISDFLEQNSGNREILIKFKDSVHDLLWKYDTTIPFEELSIEELEARIIKLKKVINNKALGESVRNEAIPKAIERTQNRINELKKEC